ncbi:hypothetical protein K3728_15240 [Rhodobacteraceae bacterium M385]|nr:hypothetical protein K3728_15240 [Rhodobacteraceae bacterium M385]
MDLSVNSRAEPRHYWSEQMFFTKVGRFIAWLIFISALIKFVAGYGILFGTETMEDNRNAARQLFNEPNSGSILDEAAYSLFIAIALGIAAEISRNVHKLLLVDENEEDIDEDV